MLCARWKRIVMFKYSNHVGLVSLAAGLLALGCGAAPESSENGSADPGDPAAGTPAVDGQSIAVPNGQINGTLLYSKMLGKDHIVAFYEFTPGVTAIYESLFIDSGEVSVMNPEHTFSSLAQFYAKLNPDAATPPTKILEADVRSEKLMAEQQITGGPPAGEKRSDLAQGISSAADGTCSGDFFGDGWGGDWYLNRACTSGNFRWCKKNFAWADSGQFSRSWATWQQMEGDFNLRGHVKGDHWHCDSPIPGIIACGWVNTVDFDFDILPRQQMAWAWNPSSNAHVAGTSQCSHLHVAFLWN